MKVHPAPKKRNITIRYNIASTFSQANALACRQKKLRRLPHIFAKVLELPFHSDADVLIDETSDCFRFVVNTDDIGDDIRTQTIEIYPGVTKIVIRGTNVLDLSMDELELDMWRFRLPASTRPELASAAYNDGQLVVMVPKDANFNGLDVVDREEEVWGEGNGDIGAGRLVLVPCFLSSRTMFQLGPVSKSFDGCRHCSSWTSCRCFNLSLLANFGETGTSSC